MKTRSTLMTIAGTLLAWTASGATAARADDAAHSYTLASLKGTYSAVATYSANVALAVRHFDGKGNLTGTYTLNAPDTSSTTNGTETRDLIEAATYQHRRCHQPELAQKD